LPKKVASRRGPGQSSFILDDEIIAWLAPIYAKTDQLVFVSDSCHAGTASRGESAIVKAGPPDTRRHLLCRQRYPRWVTPRGIRIGAARDNQSAIEKAIKTNHGSPFYSLFTLYWARALENAQQNDTWYDIFKRSFDQITPIRGHAQSPEFSQSQQPQMEGHRRHLALTSGFSPMQPTVTVSRGLSCLGCTVWLDAGHVNGVTKGSVYRLYKPEYSKPQNLPALTIDWVSDFTSYGTPTGQFKKGDLVIEQTHVYPFDPIKVYLKADQGRYDKLLQTIRSAFEQKQFPAYQLTNDPRQAEQLLYVSRSASGNTPVISILTQDGRLLHERLNIIFDNENNGLKLLQTNLNKLARIRELKLLGTDRSAVFPGDLQTLHFRPVTSCRVRPPNCIYDRGKYYRKMGEYNLKQFQEYTLLTKGSLQQGDMLIFGLHNSSRKDYYFYLIEISPDGTIQALFPGSDEVQQNYAKIKAGKNLFNLIPRLELGLKGETTLKLIATMKPIEVSLLEESRFARSGTPEKLNPLERLLFNATRGKRAGVNMSTNFQWAAEQVSFEVK